MSKFKANINRASRAAGKFAVNTARSIARPVVNYTRGVGAGFRNQNFDTGAQLNNNQAFKSGMAMGANIRSLASAGRDFAVKTLPKGLKWIGNKFAIFMGQVWKVVQRAGRWFFSYVRKAAGNAIAKAKPLVSSAVTKVGAKIKNVNTKIARAMTNKPADTTLTGRPRSTRSMKRAMNRYEVKVSRRAALLGRAEAVGAAYGAGRLIYSKLIGEMEDD